MNANWNSSPGEFFFVTHEGLTRKKNYRFGGGHPLTSLAENVHPSSDRNDGQAFCNNQLNELLQYISGGYLSSQLDAQAHDENK